MTLPPKLLIVDDGDRYAEMALQFMRGYRYATRCTLPGPCWTCPRRQGCTLTHAHDAIELDQALAQHDDVDVVLLDVAFDLPPERLLPSSEPDQEKRRRFEGLAILAHLRKRHPALSVILMTSKEDRLPIRPLIQLPIAQHHEHSIGLAVVHGIMKSHYGAISVYSQPGEGSVFHICLPLRPAAANPST